MVSVFQGFHQSKNSSKRAPDRQKNMLFWDPLHWGNDLLCVLNTNNAYVAIGQIQPFSQNTYTTIFLLPSCVCVEGLALGSTEAKKRKQKTTCLWFLEISKQNLAIRLSKGPGNLFQIQSPPNKWARTNTEIVDYVDFLLAWNNDTRATQTRQTKSKQMGFLRSRSWALRVGKSKEQDHLFCIFSR